MIYLNASDVAAAIGQNRFKTPGDIVKTYWERANLSKEKRDSQDYELEEDTSKKLIETIGTQQDKEKYESIVAETEKEKTEKENLILEHTEINKIKLNEVKNNKELSEKDKTVIVDKLVKELEITNDNLNNEIKLLETKKRTEIALVNKTIIETTLDKAVDENKTELSKEIEKEKVCEIKKIVGKDSQEAFKLEKTAKTYVNTNRGIKGEDSIINKYEADKNKKVTDRNSNLYYIDIGEFRIGGKIDGYDKSTNSLVEVKRRRNKLLGLPKYEKIQCEIYMHMLNISNCIHIEEYDGNQKERKYKSDERLWKYIEDGLDEFSEYYKTTWIKLSN